MAKFRVEMLNGDVYQVDDAINPEVDAAGNLVWYDYRRVPMGFVAAGQRR